MSNEGYINGEDMLSLEAEKYWSFPKAYKGDAKEETRNMILSGDYIGAEKIDGAYYRFVKDDEGRCYLAARALNVNGEVTDKYDWVPHLHKFFDCLPNGTCLVGEIYLDKQRGSRHVTTVMGCKCDKAIERQKQEQLKYYAFDIYAFDGYLAYKHNNMDERVGWLAKIEKNYHDPNVRFAHYKSGESLLEELTNVLAAGGEGIVMTRRNAMVEPGKRTARKTLKVKQSINEPIDAFLTGGWKSATKQYTGKNLQEWTYWCNDKTGELIEGQHYRDYMRDGVLIPVTKGFFYGWAGAIEFGVMKDGKEYGIAWISNVPDTIKKQVADNPLAMRHKVAKIRAMQIEPDTKKLRHAVVLEWRDDKPWQECDYEQLL